MIQFDLLLKEPMRIKLVKQPVKKAEQYNVKKKVDANAMNVYTHLFCFSRQIN